MSSGSDGVGSSGMVDGSAGGSSSGIVVVVVVVVVSRSCSNVLPFP